jgi:hypothetical protein
MGCLINFPPVAGDKKKLLTICVPFTEVAGCWELQQTKIKPANKVNMKKRI